LSESDLGRNHVQFVTANKNPSYDNIDKRLIGPVSWCVNEFRAETQKNQGFSKVKIKTLKNAFTRGWVAASP